MKFEDILKFLQSKASGKTSIIEQKEAILVSPDNWNEVSMLLKNESDLDFNYLMCISSSTIIPSMIYLLLQAFHDNNQAL